MNSGFKVKPPVGKFDSGCYTFGSFRCFPPNTGTLPIHCGNYFQTLFHQVYEDLNTKTEVLNQLSYFVTLQPAEIGGELEVFGLNWATGMTKSEMMDDEYITLPDGKTIQPDNHPAISITKYKPESGDLLLFQGGSIWHRVSRVYGSIPRLTFGGFLAPSKLDKSYSLWT